MMKSRRETHKRKKVPFGKLLLGAVLLIGIIGSSFTVSFANKDVESLLTNWFTDMKDHKLLELEETVEQEQKTQTDRLKEELQAEIRAAEEDLDQFTKNQKEKVSEELQRYTNELIQSFTVNNEVEEKEIRNELDKILENAKKEIKTVLRHKSNNYQQEQNSSDQENDTKDKEDEREVPQKDENKNGTDEDESRAKNQVNKDNSDTPNQEDEEEVEDKSQQANSKEKREIR